MIPQVQETQASKERKVGLSWPWQMRHGVCRQLRKLLYVGFIVNISGCHTIELPSFSGANRQTAPVQPNQQELVADFENKIAQKLIADLPILPVLPSKPQTEEHIKALDLVVNRSGININAVTPAIQHKLALLQQRLNTARYEVDHWSELQHLTGIDAILTQAESLQAQQTGSRDPVATQLRKLQANLDLQATADYRYPTQLAVIVASLIESHLGYGLNEFNLRIPTFSDPSDASAWMRNKLESVIPTEERLQAPPPIEAGLEEAKLAVINQRKSPELASLDQLYRDSYFDVRSEAQPEQTALDLLSVYLEEVLYETGFKNPVSLIGSDLPLITTRGVTQSALGVDGVSMEDRARQERHLVQARVTLKHVLKFPAFEYQSFAIDLASTVRSNPNWPENWRQSFELALAKRIEVQMIEKGAFAPEAELGTYVRLQTFYELAESELKIADGHWNLEDARSHLTQSLPYTEEQLDVIMADWMAMDGSFAVAALMLESTKKYPLTSIINRSSGAFPKDIGNFAESFKKVADSAGS